MIPYLKPTLFLNSITFATGFSVRSMYKFYDTNVLFSEYVVSNYFEQFISITVQSWTFVSFDFTWNSYIFILLLTNLTFQILQKTNKSTEL